MKRKNILLTGLIVAAVTVACVSVYAAEDVVEDVKEAVVEGVQNFRGGRGGGMQGGMKGRQNGGAYDAAVEAGILTEEAEVEAIQAYHEANRPDMEAIKEELDGLSRDEMKAYMEENYPRPEDPLQDLVDAGLIDSAQKAELEALREEFEANKPERSEGGMRGGRGGRMGGPGNGEEAPDDNVTR